MENGKKMIPKVIHYCWFGPDPIPEYVKDNVATWHEKCPGYEIRLWTNDNFDLEISPYVKSAVEHKKWAFVSDYARLYIIYELGGIYLDGDVEVLQSLNPFLHYRMFTGLEDSDAIATGLILGAVKQNQTLKKLMEIYDSQGENLDSKGSFIERTCVELTTNYFREYGFKNKNIKQHVLDCTVFPTEYFCPQRPGTYKAKITSSTYTVHHYSGSWLGEKGIKKRIKYRLIFVKAKIRKFLRVFIGTSNVEKLRKGYRKRFGH
ncbi:glycosyl transferase [Lactiplantibacillus plantarum]|uniref:Glycosyl transferase n=2 Tax=Lactiplantibacillus TaxID=2767842 RepID=A0ABS5UG26_9LACO|nr:MULTISPECIES: glycosyltransferase [Lactiplantibacillus]MBT1137489.1 glycosyl transferase [Lactiplantibacillus argentoratensis]MCB7472858.1 glycosyl transferase [Lactiplantibacillus plantarum]MCB7477786.1 glycosyl transferase [Lactiplantibacillus plantarum]MCT3268171.1 glycosyl transferase [Lactiplantibacillus plantarum]MCT3281693.1 glycosyl transferase [Lactiplantibacillus plantarum]